MYLNRLKLLKFIAKVLDITKLLLSLHYLNQFIEYNLYDLLGVDPSY